MVVDVTPRHRLERPQIAFTFWSEPDRCELENVRFLAGYRRDWLFDPVLLESLRSMDLDGRPLGEVFRLLPELPRPLVKSAVLHLLWSGHVTTDLDRPLSTGNMLRLAA